MPIQRAEYNTRKRFKTEIKEPFDSFMEKTSFNKDTIFMAYTTGGEIRYLKITSEFAQIHFDLCECDTHGEFLKNGFRRGSIHKREIAERLYEGDWLVYKRCGD